LLDLLKEAVHFVKEHYYQPKGGLALFFLVFIGVIPLLAQLPLDLPLWASLTVALAASVTVTLRWWFSVKPKKHPKQAVGIDIAIVSEEPKQQLQVRNDFVATMAKLVESSQSLCNFHLIEHPNHIAAGIKSSKDARELTEKTRGRFLIYGTAKLREIRGEQQHVLELEGLVRHKPIGPEVSQQFSSEFRKVLPSIITIPKESDFFSFLFTAEWIDIVAQYIIGIASLVSADLDTAESLFLNLEKRLLNSSSSPPSPIAKIKNSLPVRLAQVYKVRSVKLYDDYWIKRDNQILEEMELWMKKTLKYDPNWYSGHLAQAICDFVLRRDLPAAWESIKKCRKIPDTTWRYSAAFLYAYEGDLNKAYREYKNPTVPIQSEDFIHLVLEEEPEKGQLFYCLGLINLRAKKDFVAAKNDFQQFLNSEAADDFPEEQKFVRIQIGEIQRRLKEESLENEN